MRAAAAIALALGMLLAACGLNDAGGGAPAGVPPPGSASAVADVAGVRLGVAAQVWLDRMPQARPAGTAGAPGPLHVAVQVAATEGLPEGVAIDRVWVTAGERTWESPLSYLVKADGRLEGGAAGGPALEEGLPATVVVRVTAPDGVRYLQARVPQVAAAD